jgi:hypothetical protein
MQTKRVTIQDDTLILPRTRDYLEFDLGLEGLDLETTKDYKSPDYEEVIPELPMVTLLTKKNSLPSQLARTCHPSPSL